MVDRKEAVFTENGNRLKEIRKQLKKTLDDISKETGMSPSYISDFERGFRLPTSKYLRYLHDRHKVNLNFVFCSERNKLRLSEDERFIDFGSCQEEVVKLLRFMSEMPHALFSVLTYISEYKLKNKELMDRFYSEK